MWKLFDLEKHIKIEKIGKLGNKIPIKGHFKKIDAISEQKGQIISGFLQYVSVTLIYIYTKFGWKILTCSIYTESKSQVFRGQGHYGKD